MKPKTLILMIVAVGCGLAASYMTSVAISRNNNSNEEQETVPVLVAQKNLPMATLMKEPEKLFVEKRYPKGLEPKNAIKDFKDLTGRRLSRSIREESFVTKEDLLDASQSAIENNMKPGYRAVGLRVNPESIVAGFVLPQSHVDIVCVMKRSETETYSRTILQNVLVLAVDDKAIRPDDKTAVVSSVVTVMVTPAEAQKLTLAQELGTLRLTLRNIDDEGKSDSPAAKPKDLFSLSERAADDLEGETGTGTNKGDTKPTNGLKPGTVPAIPAPAPVETPKPVEAPKPIEPPEKLHRLTIYNGDAAKTTVYKFVDEDGAPTASTKGDGDKDKPEPDKTKPAPEASKTTPDKTKPAAEPAKKTNADSPKKS